MSETITNLLKQHSDVLEAYVLIRELKIYLNFRENFHPCIKIKISRNTISRETPYTFELSHHAHTPTQATPYSPSITSYQSEEIAIEQAIKAITFYVKSAIDQGHEPTQNWLVLNEDW